MKNMRRYASYNKLSHVSVDPQDAVDVVPAFQKAFLDIFKWRRTTITKLEARK